MQILHKVSLKPFNTFGINVTAETVALIRQLDDYQEVCRIIQDTSSPFLVLSGGSNLLLTADLPGIVIKIETEGIAKVEEDEHHVYIQVQAGENWNSLVNHCVGKDWGGIENLALIPGKAGSSPIQNIGAYGVELKDVIHELQAIEISTGQFRTFSKGDCQFGYRDSYFKDEGRNRFLIISVTLRLTKNPRIKSDYPAITAEMNRLNIQEPRISDVRDAIVSIRTSKLPDPFVLGNAGSFFKNPSVTEMQYHAIQKDFPEIVSYKNGDHYKLAAGWMIEQCGWKGKRVGDAGVHEKQALVLVNYGNSTGLQILNLAQNIQESVRERFGVILEMEVNII
ncbi:MAG: UDP-N-acetylmuramate dehydrogenase [Bacteroidota bacterium]